MDKKHYVQIDIFKRMTHWKEIAPCCGSCSFSFSDKDKEFCGHPLLMNRMETTCDSFCGCYVNGYEKEKNG